MDYYTCNIKLLEKKDKELANRVNAISLDLERLSFSKAKLIIDPNIDLSIGNVILAFGFGGGEHIEELLGKTQENTLIIVVDPDVSVFKMTLSKKSLDSVLSSKRVNLIIGEGDPLEAIKIAAKEYYVVGTIGEFLIVEYPPSIRANSEYYERIKKWLHRIDIDSMEKSVISECNPRWQRRVLVNIEALIKNPGIDLLDGKFKGKPAIIVSAGPSLDKNVKLLSRAKGQALIICVDTAFRTLLKYNIKPDLFVSTDPTELNYSLYLQGIDLEDIYLIADIELYPKAFSDFKDSIFVLSLADRRLVRWIGDLIGFDGYTERAGSVSHYAFDLANRMGADPIILIGQDLAYSDGKKYTAGVSEEMQQRIDEEAMEEDVLWIGDIYGNKVSTSYALWGHLKCLEKKIENTQVTCIDATEGGAKIEGTEIMPLSCAIDIYCQEPFGIREILREAKMSYWVPSIERLMDEFRKLIEEYQTINYLCHQAKENTLAHHLENLYQQVISCKRFNFINHWAIQPLLIYLRTSGENDLINSHKTFFDKIGELAKSSTFEELKRTEERLKNWR